MARAGMLCAGKGSSRPEAGLRGEPQSWGVGLPPQPCDHGGGTAGSRLALSSPTIFCLSPELPLEVLSTMRCYVRHFFGCQECAQHFEAMAAESMDRVAGREEAVLWLWSHHNEVNARLAGKGGPRGGKPGRLPKGKRGGKVEERPFSWTELANGCLRVQRWGHPVVIIPYHRGQQLAVQRQTAPEMQLSLTRSPQGASQSCHVPSEDHSS